MESSCFPAGFTYLLGFGAGLAAIIMSSWMVEYGRAAYRAGGGFREVTWDLAPRWGLAPTGAITLFFVSDSIRNRAETCLPPGDWHPLGTVLIGLGILIAVIAVIRLIHGRIRKGKVHVVVADIIAMIGVGLV